MREYTSESPEFSESIRVVEITDRTHADNVNAAPEQLLQNTLRNRLDLVELNDMFAELHTVVEALQTDVSEIKKILTPMTLAQYEAIANKTDRMYFTKG